MNGPCREVVVGEVDDLGVERDAVLAADKVAVLVRGLRASYILTFIIHFCFLSLNKQGCAN